LAFAYPGFTTLIHPGHQPPVLELISCISVSKVVEVIISDGAYKTSSVLI